MSLALALAYKGTCSQQCIQDSPVQVEKEVGQQASLVQSGETEVPDKQPHVARPSGAADARPSARLGPLDAPLGIWRLQLLHTAVMEVS